MFYLTENLLNQMKINPTKTIEVLEQESLKKIVSGEYRNEYLVYNRKSTDEPENQKNSIKYQKAENTRFAYRKLLQIAPVTLSSFCNNGIISEKHSGFKENIELTFGKEGTVQYHIDRPKFYQLVQYLSKGYFKGVIILCWDRASRNRGDDTVIRKLMKQGLDFQFTLASYDKTSSGDLHMDIDGMFAQHHSRVTSEKVSLNIKHKRDMGICTYKAPVGYLNLGEMENKPLDPIRAPIITKMFELYATGEWSLADTARFAIEQGFTMSPFRRRRTREEKLAEEEDDSLVEIEAVCRLPTYNNIHKILTNPFYTGKIIGNDGIYVPSNSHKAIVNQKLFDTVQIMLRRKKVSAHYTELLDHPLRGIIRCEACKRVYTPYPKKGIMYYGCRCPKGCPNTNRNINIKYIIDAVGKLIQHLWFNENELEDINLRATTDIALLEARRLSQLEINERKKKKIREDLVYLRNNKLTLLKTGVYTPESLVTEEETLCHQLFILKEEEDISDIAMHKTFMDVIELSELIKSVYLYYETGNSQEKETIIKKLFSELTLSGNTLKYKCIGGIQVLESRFIPMCDLTTWLSELVFYSKSIHVSIDELQNIIKGHNGTSTEPP